MDEKKIKIDDKKEKINGEISFLKCRVYDLSIKMSRLQEEAKVINQQTINLNKEIQRLCNLEKE